MNIDDAAEKMALQLEMDRLRSESEQMQQAVLQNSTSLNSEKEVVEELNSKIDTLTRTNEMLEKENVRLRAENTDLISKSHEVCFFCLNPALRQSEN